MEKEHQITFWERLGYGLGAMPEMVNSILATFLTMFYTDNIGMAAGAVGTMFFASKVLDGVSDLLAGSLIDRTRTRWGKARPWLLWLAIPIGISVALIFWVPQNGSPTVKLIYAFLTYNLFATVLYTIAGVAKAALLPLMTYDGLGRAGIAKYSLFFSIGGAILGSIVTFPFISAFGGNTMAWRIVFAIYGVLAALGTILCFALTKEHVVSIEEIASENGERDKISFTESLKEFVKNKYFLFALAVGVLMNFSMQIGSSSQAYFYVYVMNDATLMSTLGLVGIIPTIVGIVFVAGPCFKRFGKKGSAYIGCIGQIAGHAFRLLGAMTASIPLLIAGSIIGGIFTGPLAVPVGTLAADAVDYGEYLFNKRIEGMGSSITTFVSKITTGVAAGIVGWVLQLTGYVANQAQNKATVAGILGMNTFTPILMLVLIVIGFICVYKYDKEEADVRKELENRKQAALKGRQQ